MGLPTATVKLVGPDGVERVEVDVGTGPVDAVYKAVSKAINVRRGRHCMKELPEHTQDKGSAPPTQCRHHSMEQAPAQAAAVCS